MDSLPPPPKATSSQLTRKKRRSKLNLRVRFKSLSLSRSVPTKTTKGRNVRNGKRATPRCPQSPLRGSTPTSVSDAEVDRRRNNNYVNYTDYVSKRLALERDPEADGWELLKCRIQSRRFASNLYQNDIDYDTASDEYESDSDFS